MSSENNYSWSQTSTQDELLSKAEWRGELCMLCRDQTTEKSFYGKLKCLWREAACLGGVAISALPTVVCVVAIALIGTQ